MCGPLDDVSEVDGPLIGWRTGWPAGRARSVCGPGVFPLRRGDRGDLGGPQVRGGLSADDPAVPAARLGFILDDAAPIAAITTTGLIERLDRHKLAAIDIASPRNDSHPDTPPPRSYFRSDRKSWL